MPSPDQDPSVAANLAAVRRRIEKAARAAGRAADDITLIAVSKQQPEVRIEQALAAGQRVFGENRVQEAKARWSERRADLADLRLHLIGPLQTNKAEDAVALFDVIQTLDRLKLAEALARAMDRQGRRPRLMVQVNTGEEPQKAGLAPAEVDGFLDAVRGRLGLDIAGLMAIPPQDEEPALHFALLAKIARRNGLAELSMGMSGDYETAVRFGATAVRVGTSVFGAR